MVATFRNTNINEKLSSYARLRPKSINNIKLYNLCSVLISLNVNYIVGLPRGVKWCKSEG